MPLLRHLKKLHNSEPHQVMVFKGYVLKKLWVQLLFWMLYTCGICYLQLVAKVVNFHFGLTISGLYSAAIGILLVFRNQTAYERWWEGRIIWGELVNTSRNFALQFNSLLKNPSIEIRDRFGSLISAFPYALKEHLREGVKMEQLRFLSNVDYKTINKAKNKPMALVNVMVKELKKHESASELTDYEMVELIRRSDELTTIMGKCERIRNTPIPLSHRFLLKSFLFIYFVSLPITLVYDLQWWSILIIFIVNYLLSSLIIISEEIEEPFGREANDLPTDTLADKISNDVAEVMLAPAAK